MLGRETNPLDVSETSPATQPRALSFESIYEAEFSYVWNSLRRLGIPPRHLEDVSHDVFVVVHEVLPRFDVTRPIKPWLFGIAFRVASDFRRKRSNQREELVEVEVASAAPNAEGELMTRDRQALVHRALDAIQLDRRGVFVLHEIDGVAVSEIARALELPLNTAYSRLRVAREEFKAAVQRLTLRKEV